MNATLAFAREVEALTRRWFIHTARQPIALAAGLFQPLIWLLLFGAVFRSLPMQALQGAGDNYAAFLAAGVIVFTAFNSALASGVPVLFDKENGFLERLLVAPLSSRYAIIVSSALHIAAMSLLQTALVLVVASWYAGGLGLTPASVAAVFGVTGLLIIGFTTISLGLAFALRAHFEMLSLIQLVALPMIFVSSALAPLAVMPGWLRWPASLNPLTLAIEPVRRIMLGGSGPVLDAPWGTLGLAGSVGALLAFDVLAFAAVALFLRRFFRV